MDMRKYDNCVSAIDGIGSMGYISHNITSDCIMNANFSPRDAHTLYSEIVEKNKIYEQKREEQKLLKKQTQNTKLRGMIKKVIFSKPYTIVYWSDGTKTVVKKQKGDKWNKEVGLAMAMAKKLYENTNIFNEELRKWCGQQTRPHTQAAIPHPMFPRVEK